MLIKNRFGRIVDVTEERAREMVQKNEAVIIDETPKEPEKPKNELECPYCGKICKSKLGFAKHTEACKKKLSSQ